MKSEVGTPSGWVPSCPRREVRYSVVPNDQVFEVPTGSRGSKRQSGRGARPAFGGLRLPGAGDFRLAAVPISSHRDSAVSARSTSTEHDSDHDYTPKPAADETETAYGLSNPASSKSPYYRDSAEDSSLPYFSSASRLQAHNGESGTELAEEGFTEKFPHTTSSGDLPLDTDYDPDEPIPSVE